MNWLRIMDVLDEYIQKKIKEGACREGIHEQFRLTIDQLIDKYEGTESD